MKALAVAILGPTATGKSALALALVQQAAADGLRVSVARAPETAGVPAYWIWMETLRHEGGALLVVATHRDAPDEVTSALQDRVEAG